MKVAAVDIGTNSVKMVMGWQNQGQIEIMDVPPIVTRLGQGVDTAGRLDERAIERTLQALNTFAIQARNAGVTVIKAVGTSALRDASNGSEFVSKAENILGGTVEIISGDREARLVYGTARQEATTMAPDASTIVTTDVGGGSTEIVIGLSENILYCQSLQLGAVRLTERVLTSDSPTEKEVTTAMDIVDEALRDIPQISGDIAIIASGGTVANLGAMHIAEQSPAFSRQDTFRVLHGLSLTNQEIVARIHRLRVLTLSERRTVLGLEPDRADVIIAGAIIQARILHHLKVGTLFVSVRGLRYGLLYEMLASELGG